MERDGNRSPHAAQHSTGRPPSDRVQPRATRRALTAALNRLLDEGISDYSARTRASRRRMAALYAGFVYAEELLVVLARRGRATLPLGAAIEELARVLRHLLFWATIDGTEDPSAATRAAVDGARRALVRATGSADGVHLPSLLDCERCAAPGAELPGSARGDALCGSCARRVRRLRAV